MAKSQPLIGGVAVEQVPARAFSLLGNTPDEGSRGTELVLRNSSGLLERNKFETHGFCLCTEFDFLTLLQAQLIGSETPLTKFLTADDQVKDDARQFVSRRGDGFRPATWLDSFGALSCPSGL